MIPHLTKNMSKNGKSVIAEIRIAMAALIHKILFIVEFDGYRN